MTEYQSNLVPYLRIHFMLSSYASIISAEKAWMSILLLPLLKLKELSNSSIAGGDLAALEKDYEEVANQLEMKKTIRKKTMKTQLKMVEIQKIYK